MSEFSDSYHLRADDIEAGIGLLRAAGLPGYVLPPVNGWVTVLADGEPFQPNRPLIAAAPGVLLHYMYAADDGWGFEVYRGGQAVSAYECDWLRRFHVKRDDVDPAVLGEVLGDGFRALSPGEIERIFHPAPDDVSAWFDADGPQDWFAEAAGLTNYSWLSFEYVDQDYDDDDEYSGQGVVRVE